MTKTGGTLCGVPAGFGHSTAIASGAGTLTYDELERRSAAVALGLLGDFKDLMEARVAYLVAPGPMYSVVQWGIWRAGGMAVPLALSHPAEEHRRVFEDTRPECVVVNAQGVDRGGESAVRTAALETGTPVRLVSELAAEKQSGRLPEIEDSRGAQILFTSGTTGRPKGVVHSHANLVAQTRALVEAWEWSPHDRILHVLPLHHVHGIVNCLCCPLSVGACVEYAGSFDAARVWERLASGEITVFMAVPTVYHKLLATLDRAPPQTRGRWVEGVRALRLAVSGSAALPVPVFEQWREATGLTLLERYGMTEIGMALSNPLAGERRPGTVGQALPGVRVRLVDADGTPVPDNSPGEVEVQGPQVFEKYWERPAETAKAFRDGWFRTGDDAVLEDGYYRILGRRSVDILKSGGYKLSALEIEAVLLEHPEIAQCAVVGVQDPEWGQVVGVAVVRADHPAGATDADGLEAWARERMAPYKVPRLWTFVEALPRNAMGKVQKPAVAGLFD